MMAQREDCYAVFLLDSLPGGRQGLTGLASLSFSVVNSFFN
jgi:hypothetical protein